MTSNIPYMACGKSEQTFYTQLQPLTTLASDLAKQPCCLSSFTGLVLMLRSCLVSLKMLALTTVDFSSITIIQL